MKTRRWIRVNGKLVKARLFDIGPRSWRKITKAEKDHAFDNYIRQKFHWNAEDEDTIRRNVIENFCHKQGKLSETEDLSYFWFQEYLGEGKGAETAKIQEDEWGRPPTRGELFRETHQRTKRSGPDKYPNEETREAVATVERFMEDPATHNHISLFDAVGRAFNEKEHHGRVHGLGFGPTPSQVFGSASNSQRPASQSSIYTDPRLRLFTDGVLCLEVFSRVTTHMVTHHLERRHGVHEVTTSSLVRCHGVHEVTTSSLVRLGDQRLLPPRS
ncbi:hypothetical protein LINPERHAP1_LOCUS15790 [Linum perenne]